MDRRVSERRNDAGQNKANAFERARHVLSSISFSIAAIFIREVEMSFAATVSPVELFRAVTTLP